MSGPLSFSFASDSSLLIKLEEGISLEAHRRVLQTTRLLLNARLKPIRNLHPAYNSVLIVFDPLKTNHSEIELLIKSVLEKSNQEFSAETRTIEIPAVYGGNFGPDLKDVAERCGLGEKEVVKIHSSATYTVYFLGFSPGFPYLGGLPEKLSVPRLPNPRTKVHAGSVAIGGNQTGIYPIESPGGWRIIGRTPLRLFNPMAKSPTLLQMGDIVRFVPISEGEFTRLAESGKP